MKQPTTLLEAIQAFSDPDRALDFVVHMRWPDGVHCPYCGTDAVGFIATRRIWRCKPCKKQFSAKVGTIFEDSPIGFDKWLPAMWLICNAKNGISSYELHRAIGVTQKSAWFMLHRLRLAMQTGSFEKMIGTVEADETFIGGKARNMHKSVRERKITGTGGMGKVAVMGLLERHGKDGHSRVRTQVIPNTRRESVQAPIREHVAPGSQVMTDALRSYSGLEAEYIHNVIDHAELYVWENVHTNGIENFWSLLKRCIHGTYVSVEPFHLFRYLDEEAYRFNERQGTDQERFVRAIGQVVGKRLTYKNLTGKTAIV